MPASPEILARPSEVLAAAPDVVSRALGLAVSHPHPLAHRLTLGDVALCLGRKVMQQQPFEPDRAVQARGMGTADFPRLLADASQGLVERRYSTAADHLSYALPVELPDYKPFALPAVDAEGVTPEPVGELGELVHGRIMLPAGAANATLGRYGRAIGVSRQALVNGALAALQATTTGAAVATARLEARLVASALENPAALDDGAQVFHADHGNVLAQALDASSLGAAMGQLRTQKTPDGVAADIAARHLVVAPELEFAARKLVFEGGMSAMLNVHVLAGLPAGRWYLLGDPSLQPAVGTLRLAGVRVPVAIEPMRSNDKFDGVTLGIRADVGAAMLGRLGIVRGGA